MKAKKLRFGHAWLLARGRLLKNLCLSVAVAVAAMQPTAALAITAYFCGNASSDFGRGCSLSELIAGGSIQVDQIVFRGFKPLPLPPLPPGLPPSNVDTRQVQVFGAESGLDVGLGFFGNGEFASIEEDNFQFRYLVESNLPAEPLDMNTLLLRGIGDGADIKGYTFAPPEGGTAEVRVEENVFKGVAGTTFLGSKGVGAGRRNGLVTESLQSSIAFPATRALTVDTKVSWSGSGGPGGPSGASVDFFYQTFRRVPEPGTLALLGLGLVGLGLSRRRQVGAALAEDPLFSRTPDGNA